MRSSRGIKPRDQVKMRVALFLIALIGLGFAEFEEEDNVLVLKSEDFQQAIDTFPYILVEFCKFI